MAWSVCLLTMVAMQPADLQIWPPLPGMSSTLCTGMPTGMSCTQHTTTHNMRFVECRNCEQVRELHTHGYSVHSSAPLQHQAAVSVVPLESTHAGADATAGCISAWAHPGPGKQACASLLTLSGSVLPGRMLACGPDSTASPGLRPWGARM